MTKLLLQKSIYGRHSIHRAFIKYIREYVPISVANNEWRRFAQLLENSNSVDIKFVERKKK